MNVTKPAIRNGEIGNESIFPITLEIELERVNNSNDTSLRKEYAKCHFYIWKDSELTTGIELFVIDAGRPRLVGSYRGVLSVNEIEPEDANG